MAEPEKETQDTQEHPETLIIALVVDDHLAYLNTAQTTLKNMYLLRHKLQAVILPHCPKGSVLESNNVIMIADLGRKIGQMEEIISALKAFCINLRYDAVEEEEQEEGHGDPTVTKNTTH